MRKCKLPKKDFIVLDETTVDANHVIGYQRNYDAKLNKSEIVIALAGGAVLKLNPTDELHTPEMVALLDAHVKK